MSKSLVRSQFARSAEDYAVSPVHAKGRSLERMVELARPEAHWRLLDIATGAGHAALAFAPHVGHVVASDMTPRMLEVAQGLARERGVENISFEEADAEALSFADASFDCVTCRIAPHHFSDIDAFISEVARVLKPGGTFALVDNMAPDRHTTEGFSEADLDAAAAYFNRFEKVRDPGHARALQLDEWLGRLGQAGFAVLHHEMLLKPMAFEAWADRIHAGTEAKAELRAMADDAPRAVRVFLRPETREGELWLTWAEGLIIARHG